MEVLLLALLLAGSGSGKPPPKEPWWYNVVGCGCVLLVLAILGLAVYGVICLF